MNKDSQGSIFASRTQICHPVAAARQQAQKGGRFAGIGRFAQNPPPRRNRGIGAEHDLAGRHVQGRGLGRRDAAAVMQRRFAGYGGVVDMGRAHSIGDHPEAGQKLGAPGRAGAENQPLFTGSGN